MSEYFEIRFKHGGDGKSQKQIVKNFIIDEAY